MLLLIEEKDNLQNLVRVRREKYEKPVDGKYAKYLGPWILLLIKP